MSGTDHDVPETSAATQEGAHAAPLARQAPAQPLRPPRMIDRVLGEVTEELAELTTRGFQFAKTRDARGNVVAISGVRSHSSAIDIVQLFGEHDADAVRIPASEPDILFPRTVLWRATGRPETVLKAILGLADPTDSRSCAAPPTARRRPWMSQLSFRSI